MARKKKKHPVMKEKVKTESYDVGNAIQVIVSEKGASISTKSGIWKCFYSNSTQIGTSLALLCRSTEDSDKIQLRNLVLVLFYTANFANETEFLKDLTDLTLKTYERITKTGEESAKVADEEFEKPID